MLLFYVRHGDPTYNPDELTPLGRRQAEAIGRRLATFGVDKIFSSTSTRAMQTADPLCEIMKMEKTTMEFCHESLAYHEVKVKHNETEWRWVCDEPTLRPLLASAEVVALGKQWYEHPALAEYRDRFKQCMDRVGDGIDKFIAELGYEHVPGENIYRVTRHNDDRVALFAHAGVGRVIISHMLDIPYPQFALRSDMSHTGMTVIEFRDEGGWCLPRLLTYSADGHLYHDGMPTAYNNHLRF